MSYLIQDWTKKELKQEVVRLRSELSLAQTRVAALQQQIESAPPLPKIGDGKDGERLAVLEWLGDHYFFPDWDDDGFWHTKIGGTRVIGTTLREFCDEAIAIRVAMSADSDNKA